MKTLNLQNLKNIHSCITFRQSLCVFMTCLSFSICAAEKTKQTESITRRPSAIEEEVLTVPLSNDESFFTNENIFAEDDAGVMKDMKSSLHAWEVTEEYEKAWGLESTGLYNTPTTSQKGKYISKKMLRYVDKRLSGEMKKADEGSTLHKVGKMEKNLRPNTAVNISKNFGLKFKARVLQGKAVMEVKNPWVECNATVSANGKARLITRKDFKELGLASGVEYSVNDSQFLAYIDQQVTNNIKARVSNTSGNDADSRVEMWASFPFNL
jgi:hypothetical protein